MAESLQLVPTQGGDLITNTSENQAGLANWVEKLNFRRHFADEARREGDVLLRLNSQLALSEQPYLPVTYVPTLDENGDLSFSTVEEEVNLIANARHPNGTTAIIIATPSTIYRFLGDVSEQEGGTGGVGASSIDVYYPSPFAGATGVDALLTSYPVYGVQIKSAGGGQITIDGDWSDIPLGSAVQFTNGAGQIHQFNILARTAYDSLNDQTIWTVQEGIPTPQSPDSPVDPTATYAAFAPSTPYAVGVIVSYASVLYVCTSSGTSDFGSTPLTDTGCDWSQVGLLSNLASLALGDLMTGPEELMPVYATSATNLWEPINPRLNPCDPESEPYLFGTTGYHRWEIENINGVLIFNNGYDLPFYYDLTKIEGSFIYELRDNGYAFLDNMASLNGILTFQDTAEFNSSDHPEQMNKSDERGINGYFGAYGPVRDLTKITRVQYQMIGAPTGQPTRWGPALQVDTTLGSDLIVADYPIASWEEGDEIRIEEAGVSAGYPAWSNGVSYGTGIIVSFSGLLYQSQNSGISSGTSPTDDIGVSWINIGSDVNINLNADLINSFYSLLKIVAAQPGAIASGGVLSFDIGRQTVTLTEGVEITLTSTAEQIRDAFITKYNTNVGTEWDDLRTKFALTAQGTDEIKISATGFYANCEWPTVYNLSEGTNSGVDLIRTVTYQIDTTADATQTDATALEPDIYTFAPQPFAYPLQDDSSEILRAKELQNRLIIFKDTAIFQATLTGDTNDPLSFKLLYRGNDSVYWRWTLTLVGSGNFASRGDFLIYAGRNKFYKFDLTTNTPTVMDKLSFCDNLFFEHNAKSQMERVYGAINSLTSEVWFTIPEGPEHKVLAWDWRWNTCSTIDYYPTAAETCELDTGDNPSTHYFLFARASDLQTATMYMYGLTNRPQSFFGGEKSVYSRGGYYDVGTQQWVNRSSIPNGILAGIGPQDEYNDEILQSYQVILTSDSVAAASIVVTLFGKINPHAVRETLFSKVLSNPETENSIQTYYLKHNYQDKVQADSYAYVGISKRIFDFLEVKSESATKDTDA